jgi:hypothetical protein
LPIYYFEGRMLLLLNSRLWMFFYCLPGL